MEASSRRQHRRKPEIVGTCRIGTRSKVEEQHAGEGFCAIQPRSQPAVIHLQHLRPCRWPEDRQGAEMSLVECMIRHVASKQVHQLRKRQLSWCLASDWYELTDKIKQLSVRETSATGGTYMSMSRTCKTGRGHMGKFRICLQRMLGLGI